MVLDEACFLLGLLLQHRLFGAGVMAKPEYLLCFVVFIGNKVLMSSVAEFWKYVSFLVCGKYFTF